MSVGTRDPVEEGVDLLVGLLLQVEQRFLELRLIFGGALGILGTDVQDFLLDLQPAAVAHVLEFGIILIPASSKTGFQVVGQARRQAGADLVVRRFVEFGEQEVNKISFEFSSSRLYC